MNTISNPLTLKTAPKYNGDKRYFVSKDEDQSGEYVDKALAEEAVNFIENLCGYGKLSFKDFQMAREIIEKARG